MSFKKWLEITEGMTSFSQVQMIPQMGNADLKRCDIRSKWNAMAGNCSKLPPAGATKKNKPSHPPEFMDKDDTGFGFDKQDRKKAKSRSKLRHIDKRRKSVPIRTPEVYD